VLNTFLKHFREGYIVPSILEILSDFLSSQDQGELAHLNQVTRNKDGFTKVFFDVRSRPLIEKCCSQNEIGASSDVKLMPQVIGSLKNKLRVCFGH
jgi:hypothetical protein